MFNLKSMESLKAWYHFKKQSRTRSAPAMYSVGAKNIHRRRGRECYRSTAKANICSREKEWANYFDPGYSSLIHSFVSRIFIEQVLWGQEIF